MDHFRSIVTDHMGTENLLCIRVIERFHQSIGLSDGNGFAHAPVRENRCFIWYVIFPGLGFTETKAGHLRLGTRAAE